MQVRPLLDLASSAFFVTGQFVQHLRLHCKNQHVQIAGIVSALHDPSSHTVTFGVSRLQSKGDKRSPHQLQGMGAVVLPNISAPLSAFPVPFNRRWKHLTGLRLADRDFGIPGPVDILLGPDVFSHMILHSRQSGPSRTPSLEMSFRWVLSSKHTPSIHDSQRFPVPLHLSIQEYPHRVKHVCTRDLGKRFEALDM